MEEGSVWRERKAQGLHEEVQIMDKEYRELMEEEERRTTWLLGRGKDHEDVGKFEYPMTCKWCGAGSQWCERRRGASPAYLEGAVAEPTQGNRAKLCRL